MVEDHSDVEVFIVWTITLLLLGAFIFTIYLSLAKYNKAFKGELSPYQLGVVKVILEKNLPYFKSLSLTGQMRYLERLTILYFGFQFFGRKSIKINVEMKTLICSAIVQISYGWKKFDLSKFQKVIIFPKNFQLADYMPEMIGATSEGGRIYFSWQDLKMGYDIPDDGINLAIHEIAHAVKLNYLEDIFSKSSHRYRVWKKEAERVLDENKKSKEPFFRKYVKSDMDEFFSGVLENFFERPREFKLHHAKLFNTTCNLLNQNPLNPKSDYALSD